MHLCASYKEPEFRIYGVMWQKCARISAPNNNSFWFLSVIARALEPRHFSQVSSPGPKIDRSHDKQAIVPSKYVLIMQLTCYCLPSLISSDPTNRTSESQHSSDASPMLFKAAQWNIKQSSDCRGHFKADITSLACDRARIPHLTH